jgi:outer membrane receptor protein involved in Fe transport
MANNQFRVRWYIQVLCIVITLLSVLTVTGLAQTTGKISGMVTNTATGEPLIGANITIEKTSMGAVTDINGEYYIINIPLGTYRLRASMIGYEPMVIQDLVVSVNRTTTADFKLKEGVIEEKEVVVTVERIQQKKDQTSSIRNITSEQMALLPVENLDGVVGLQAGVVRGHFRGGRDNEVAYLINGVRVQEAYNLGRSITVENDAIEEVEVITGTFNAEYGNAMSGVVNAVTKDGGSTLKGSVAALGGDYFTPRTYVYNDLAISRLSNLSRNGNDDFKFNLEGPVIGNALTFFVDGRYQNIQGPRNGIRRFMPDNYSDWSSQDSTQWRSDHTGDNSIVPIETNRTMNIFGKLSFKPLAMMRASLEYSYNDAKGDNGSNNVRGGYNFFYKYNPEGMSTNYGQSQLFTATLNHALSSSFFYELKASYMKDWNAIYCFENPTETVKNSVGGDSLNMGHPVYRYVHDDYASNSGPLFSTGGQDKTWDQNWIEDYKVKFDATWQLNKQHTLKAGVDLTQHNIHRFNSSIINAGGDDYYDDPILGKRVYYDYTPFLVTDAKSASTDIYVVKPWEGAVYLQDKMEFDLMVINLGLRYDCFEPNTTYPSEPRNPDNAVINSPQSVYLQAPFSDQISPRVGLSYKLGNAALLRFSYGHFFQMPPLYSLYTNHYHVVGGDYQVLMGNPLVKPQKTIQYEAGLWQELGSNMSLEVAVFYRDIYDLLGTQTITTFNQIHYGLYSNKDYGNVRGLELKYDYSLGDFFAAVNYTLQYTRGNSNYPTYNWTRAGQRMDPVVVLIPMDFDQRHTLNASIGYNTERYGGSIIGRYDSGEPYTWTPLATIEQANVYLQPNNSTKPAQISFDLNGFVNLWSSGSTRTRLTLIVYNIFDRLNEINVNATTGRANDRIYLPTDIAGYKSNFTTIYDYTNDPSSFTNPRFIKMGIEFMF